ncbi:anti-sigma factor family protein [Streptomyces sp. NPDC090029]|uniref:anti-sigma factor family protein n=1 Tax=Streptomyces sp. NPDC090029 TaxID=3365924 RepID=UPI00382D257C
MTGYDRREQESVHDAVGAYVLGVLDDADASAFEAHLAGCDICAARLDEFSGIEPMLAMLADAPAPAPAAPPGNVYGLPGFEDFPQPRPATAVVPAAPGPRVLEGLLDEVAARRAAKRRRGMYLVAAAAALIIGAPAVAVQATSGSPSGSTLAADPHPTSPAEDAFFHHMEAKAQATDATTKVSAVIGMESKGWGTHAVLELKNVRGPLKCSLVAVSKTGEEEIVTSWSVPKWGYGIPDSPEKSAKAPLYVHGGAAMERNDIDHFEVRTFDGKRLVEVDV